MAYYDHISCSSEWQKKHNYDNIVRDDAYCVNGIPEPSWVLDVGANFGVFSARCRQLFGKNPFILAIEGDSDTYKHLLINSLRYGFDTILAPIGSLDGKSVKTYGKNNTNNPGSWQVKEQEGPCNGGCTRTLESLIIEYGVNLSKRGILKIDCEGCERYIILNLDLMRCMWQISMEYHLFDEEIKDIALWFHNEIQKTHDVIRQGNGKIYECVYRKRT
jgi:FkbM family methyltransferase